MVHFGFEFAALAARLAFQLSRLQSPGRLPTGFMFHSQGGIIAIPALISRNSSAVFWVCVISLAVLFPPFSGSLAALYWIPSGFSGPFVFSLKSGVASRANVIALPQLVVCGSESNVAFSAMFHGDNV